MRSSNDFFQLCSLILQLLFFFLLFRNLPIQFFFLLGSFFFAVNLLFQFPDFFPGCRQQLSHFQFFRKSFPETHECFRHLPQLRLLLRKFSSDFSGFFAGALRCLPGFFIIMFCLFQRFFCGHFLQNTSQTGMMLRTADRTGLSFLQPRGQNPRLSIQKGTAHSGVSLFQSFCLFLCLPICLLSLPQLFSLRVIFFQSLSERLQTFLFCLLLFFQAEKHFLLFPGTSQQSMFFSQCLQILPYGVQLLLLFRFILLLLPAVLLQLLLLFAHFLQAAVFGQLLFQQGQLFLNFFPPGFSSFFLLECLFCLF